jgi:hypothetical protein
MHGMQVAFSAVCCISMSRIVDTAITFFSTDLVFGAHALITTGKEQFQRIRGLPVAERPSALACKAARASEMSIVDHVFPRQQIEAPQCNKCGARMWLARIEPYAPDHDKRTYECPECNAEITEIVKYR